MRISKDFPGGNIEVISITEDEVVIERELRDNRKDWFYWAFCVEDACPKGKESHTVKFSFAGQPRVAKFGAAVSHDLIHWEWTDTREGESFSYTFKPEEKAYFAFCFIYSDEMLRMFAKENGIEIETFCISRKGREVPCFRIGDGEKIVLFVSRHHACESSGTYLMQGIAKACLEDTPKGYTFLFVPFVDYDGVMDGDQGKYRAPHDHNGDYGEDASIYPETDALRKLADSGKVWASFDLHAPYIDGKEHDRVYVFKKPDAVELNRCLELWKEATAKDENSFTYDGEWDWISGVNYNKPKRPTMRTYYSSRVKSGLALTVETSYSGSPDNRFSAERIYNLGGHFYRAFATEFFK